MIKMTRMRLINWHNFQNELINFENLTYLMGVNAVGKTTIMDAIRYCLTTNKDFNIAGNKKSTRTLLGSVHQKQRADDSYLRPKHTVSYIGVEFLDEKINQKFVIIARIESQTPKQDLKGVYQDWYITDPGFGLDEVKFLIQNQDGIRPSSKDEFKLENKAMYKAVSQTDAKSRICYVLGIGKDDNARKFNKVFHMGTSLEDIKDIREFIYTYILPEPQINLEKAQEELCLLVGFEENLQKAQNELKLLEPIKEAVIQIRQKTAKLKINELLISYASYQNNTEQITLTQNEISNKQQTLEILEQSLENLDQQRHEQLNKMLEIQQEIASNPEYREIEFFKNDLQNKAVKYKMYLNEASRFNDLKQSLFKLKDGLNSVGFLCEFDLGDDQMILDERISKIQNARQLLQSLEEKLNDKYFDIEKNIYDLNLKSSTLENKIQNLETGIMCYPDNALLLKNTINKILINNGEDEEAKFLCELLYIKDTSWQDALESYLGDKRFNIIISPKNYLSAKKVFMDLKSKLGGVGLIDTRKITEIKNEKNEENYLINKIDSQNFYAKNYLGLILENIICCDDENTKNYNKALTKNLLKFENHSLEKMQEQTHFIGADVIWKHLEMAKLELRNIKENLSEFENKKAKFNPLFKSYTNFMAGENFKNLEQYADSNNQAQRLNIQINELEDKIKQLKDNPVLLSKQKYFDECKKNLKELEAQRDVCAGKKEGISKEIKQIEVENLKLKAQSDDLKESYETAINEYPQYEHDMKSKYENERKSKSAYTISKNFADQIQKDKSAIEQYQIEYLHPAQQAYNNLSNTGYSLGLDEADEYLKRYESIKNIELEKHKNNIRAQQDLCKERFKYDILAKLKDAIISAKRSISQINRVLSDKNMVYGNEKYYFKVEKSKNKELGLLYDLITDDNNHGVPKENELEAMMMQNEGYEIFDRLFNDFMDKVSVYAKENAANNLSQEKLNIKSVQAYVDYRIYLDYDIIVENTLTGAKAPLSKVGAEGSGGENQAPFYVAICASLLQIYDDNNESIRLVLLDEAFNNMTSDRIEPMMRMFKDLNLQVVLIAVAEKGTAIIDHCDLTYAIVGPDENGNVAFKKA